MREQVQVAAAIEAGHALGIQLRTMSERFTKLIGLMATLRAVNVSSWDRKQTHKLLKPTCSKKPMSCWKRSIEAIEPNCRKS
ncbi:MAG: hypothetical protein A4E20_02515 [Nitrospira sp. SG-bin2]|nr:MAG: hypothetical protein A4E20_02515 [Nitrospira sp. SG-bin2]